MATFTRLLLNLFSALSPRFHASVGYSKQGVWDGLHSQRIYQIVSMLLFLRRFQRADFFLLSIGLMSGPRAVRLALGLLQLILFDVLRILS
jgi:hypothetical protein